MQKDTSRVLNSVELGTQEQMIEMNVQQLHRRVLVKCLREPSGPHDWRTMTFGCLSTTTKKIPHNQNSTGRTSPNAQTQHKAKFDALFCKEWELQCECVGKLMNHCCVAKRQQRQGEAQRDTIRRLAPLLDTTQSKTSRDLDKGGINWDSAYRSYLSSGIFNDLRQWDPCWHLLLFSLDVAKRGKWAMTQGAVSVSNMHLRSVLLVVMAAFGQIFLR